MDTTNEALVSMDGIAAAIRTAGKTEIICVAARRYVELYPQWDFSTDSKNTNGAAQIDLLIAHLEKLKE